MPQSVVIYSVTEIPPGAVVEGEVAQVAITYATPEVPPRTVYIDKDKDTPEERQRVIKADLEAVRAEPRETLEIP